MTKLRFGILSTGNIARQFAEGVNGGATRATLAAVGSRSAESARAFAQQHNIRAAHGSYAALLNDPNVDAIYLALPNSMHKDWTLKALAAGKHVLCEKPMALNEAETAEMFAAAKQHGRMLIEAFMYRCHPQTHAVVQAVRDGLIGELKLIRSTFCYRTINIAGNVRFDAALGGGALMDIGCYCVDFSRLIAGAEPTAVHAIGRLHEDRPGTVDVSASGMLQFPAGIEATFSCAMDTQTSNLAQICGTEGYIEVPVPWKPPAEGATWSLHRMTPPKQDDSGSGGGGPSHETFRIDAGKPLYGLEADAFARCVLDGERPFMTEAESVGNARVLDELKRQVLAMR